LTQKQKGIEIEVIKGGKHYISVKDDGVGIHPGDLPKVILPFYTSKIERFEDLLSLKTYGFRGEALHAIAQVSRIGHKLPFLPRGQGLRNEGGGGKGGAYEGKGYGGGHKGGGL
jgi:DNA mismatch repair protein MutL